MELIKKYFPGLTGLQISRFEALKPLYESWNLKVNVISRKDIDNLYVKHVLHSLTIGRYFPFPSGSRVVDVGTGGGFPGIPLAILFPEVKFHLIDSIGKKLKVVEAVKKALDLGNVSFEHARIEDTKEAPFDFAVTRAVASLDKLWHWTAPHLKKRIKNKALSPALICLKGGDLSQEIKGCRRPVKVMELTTLFPEEIFKEKYVLLLRK